MKKLKVLIVLAYFSGVVGVLAIRSLRQQRGYRALLWLTGIYFIVLTFTDGRQAPQYLVHMIPLYTALVAGTVVWLWRNDGTIVRGAIVATLAVLSVINLGGIAYQVRKDDYHKHYLPTISFLKQNVRDDQLLMGPGTLGFGLVYPTNLIDDFRLGALNGKTPDWIVVNDWWKDYFFTKLEVVEPANYRFVRKRLDNDFRLVYQDGSYDVYSRK